MHDMHNRNTADNSSVSYYNPLPRNNSLKTQTERFTAVYVPGKIFIKQSIITEETEVKSHHVRCKPEVLFYKEHKTMLMKAVLWAGLALI